MELWVKLNMDDKHTPKQAVVEADANTAVLHADLMKASQRLLTTQITLTIGVAIGFYLYQGFSIFILISAVYGGFIAIFNVWLAVRRLQSAAKQAEYLPGTETGVFYLGAVQRFIATLSFLF